MSLSVPSFRAAPSWPHLAAQYDVREVCGVAVDSEDTVFVFARSTIPILVFDRAGELQAAWGEGLFKQPHGIFVDDEAVWCADYGDHTVRKFTKDGVLLLEIGTAGVPSDTGTTERNYKEVVRSGGPFNGPTDVAVGSDGQVFVSDGYGNARINVFDKSGALRGGWGSPGSDLGEFRLPHSVSLGQDELLYVADRENARVQVFDRTGMSIRSVGDLHRPDDAVLSEDGMLYVAELGYLTRLALKLPAPPGRPHSAIAVLAYDGALLCRLGTADPSAAGSFHAAHALAFDSHGDLYVADVGLSAAGGQAPAGYRPIQKLERMS